MKLHPITIGIVGLFIVFMTYVNIDQNNKIAQQRQLIREFASSPECMLQPKPQAPPVHNPDIYLGGPQDNDSTQQAPQQDDHSYQPVDPKRNKWII